MKRRFACGLAAAVCLALAAPAVPAVASTVGAVDTVGTAGAENVAGTFGGGQRQTALEGLTRAGATSAIAEIRDRAGVWRGTSGVSDQAAGAPVRGDGRFRAGSVTKMFVATTVLQLSGEHRLGLDDPVERYLPGLIPNGANITLRQLLNHSSGLWDPTNEKGGIFPDEADLPALREWVAKGGLNRTVTARELVAASTAHAPYFPPGTRHHYSNVNYTLLGMIIERVTGHGYAQEVSARILRPLGMTRTTFPGLSRGIPGPHAHGYLTLGESPDPAQNDVDVTEHNPSWAGAAGELISTTDDLLRFERALIGGKLLKPSLMREMTSMIPLGEEKKVQAEYGLGLARVQLSCGEILGHNGGIFGYSTELWGTADRQVALSFTPRGGEAEQTAQAQADWAFLNAAFCGKR
ncbi:serine hydrolase domain-containing protein [Kitasatospora sp. NPDC088548]|uniref:serine hydrolase domain-containing protein n=1 Tax=Kitasatospora sp. NPDC088548 TaxID=3364075 RepID=UPI0038046B73